MNANRSLVRAGFLLFLLALVLGFVIPMFLSPRLALAAHVNAILNALLLVGLGLAWGLLALTPAREKLTVRLFLYAAYANLAGSCVAAAWGTSRLTPMAAGGLSAVAWKENVVMAIQVSVALAVLVATVLVIHALRPSTATASSRY